MIAILPGYTTKQTHFWHNPTMSSVVCFLKISAAWSINLVSGVVARDVRGKQIEKVVVSEVEEEPNIDVDSIFEMESTSFPDQYCNDVSGVWETRDTEVRMVLTQGSGGVLTGTYNDGPNAGWFGLDGRKAVEKPTLGFTAIWAGGDSVTSWTGDLFK